MPAELCDDNTTNRASILADQGAALAEEGRLHNAAQRFQEACALEPLKAELHEQLAQILAELGHYEGALRAAETAVSLSPQWVDALRTLARTETNCGKLAQAVRTFKSALDCCAEVERAELAVELAETESLLEQQLAQRVGLAHLKIRQSIGGQEGPGCVVWECGILLAEYLVSLGPGQLAGKRILELGSGTGLVGIAAALLGANVVLTDLPEMMPLLQQNIARNRIQSSESGATADTVRACPSNSSAEHKEGKGSGRACVLDWSTSGLHCGQGADGAFDLILAADPVYQSLQVPLFAGALRCLKAGELLLCHKRRHESVDGQLFAELEQLGWILQQVAVSPTDGRIAVYCGRVRAS